MHNKTLAELSRALQGREIGAEELARHCLSRIESLDPALNAFITVVGDAALDEARAADAAIARGDA